MERKKAKNGKKAMEKKLNRKKVKNTETTEKHKKATEFCFRKDIVYTAPRMKYFITIHENGRKNDCKNTTCQCNNAFVVKANPDISISISAFAKLKPKNVLLLKDTQFVGNKAK